MRAVRNELRNGYWQFALVSATGPPSFLRYLVNGFLRVFLLLFLFCFLTLSCFHLHCVEGRPFCLCDCRTRQLLLFIIGSSAVATVNSWPAGIVTPDIYT